MRLTGGEGKGRKLLDPPQGVKPTTGRVKEVLFQLLHEELPRARVLDLFAGTGALGIEALARGADRATFVEQHRAAQAVIRENLKRCRFQERGNVIPGDVFKKLGGGRLFGPFDLVFADPPYGKDWLEPLGELLLRERLVHEKSLLVYEDARREEAVVPEGWREEDRRRIGDTRLLLLAPLNPE